MNRVIITLSLNPEEIVAIARMLNSKAAGVGYLPEDAASCDHILAAIVGQGLLEGVDTTATRQVYDRTTTPLRRRRLPKSTRIAGPGRAA